MAFCYDFVNPRGCKNRQCARRHDITLCSCGILGLNENVAAHLKGRPHQQALASLQSARGPAFSSRPSAPPAAPRPPQNDAAPGLTPTGTGRFFCNLCKWEMNPGKARSHARYSEQHIRLQRVLDMRTEVEQVEVDREGITVSSRDGVDFGIVESQDVQSMQLTITNTSRRSFEIREHRLTSSLRRIPQPSRFTINLTGGSRSMASGQSRTAVVEFHPAHAGRYAETIEFLFYDTTSRRLFVITRKVSAIVGSREEHEFLRPRAPYVPRSRRSFQREDKVVRTLRPETWSETSFVVRLPEYTLPQNVIDSAQRRDARQVFISFLPRVFDVSTYGRRFQVLLQLEEVQMALDLQSYSIEDGKLTAARPRYVLPVPGLEEGRPGVLVGDFVRVKLKKAPGETWWEGRVHEVKAGEISIRFSDAFSIYHGNGVEARFQLNRLPLRRMLAALLNQFNPARLLFPTIQHVPAVPLIESNIEELVPFNRKVGQDKEQLDAVIAVLKQPLGSVPFVLFGPPGTGKTIVAVECIRQLLDRDENTRLLVCAPSNSAADLISTLLLDLGPTQVFRLNATSRNYMDLPKPLRSISLFNDHLVFAIPSLEKMKSYRVIVSTCISGGIPQGIGMPRGWFNHILIDEAGQATEPEVMIPIKSMAGERTNVALFGDPQQLGPICASKVAQDLGLKTSYLARIMDLSTYDLKTMRNRTVVKLVRNFRNHPAILEFPSAQFYSNELQPAADSAITHSLARSEQLVKQGFPIVFHGIVGKDERESSNPSYFNREEAILVKNYCLALVGDRKSGIRGAHIGVIAPYHAQVIKVRELCRREPKLDGIKVGSVEEFQGQERRIIVLSTVRSTTDYVHADLRRNLGFVANPRRFNVAVTRAQAMLIVIGNPKILSLDSLWRAFLNYIHRQGGWRGVPIGWDSVEPVLARAEYDRDLRERAESDLEDDLARLRAIVFEHSEDLAVPEVGGVNEDDEDACGAERGGRSTLDNI